MRRASSLFLAVSLSLVSTTAGICWAQWGEPQYTGSQCIGSGSMTCATESNKACAVNPNQNTCYYCVSNGNITTNSYCVPTSDNHQCIKPNPLKYLSCGDQHQGLCNTPNHNTCTDNGVLIQQNGCAQFIVVGCTGTN